LLPRIPSNIGNEFRFPKIPSGTRDGGKSTILVAMPETPVNEYHLPPPEEDDIG
jgi:hypothetical protein